jgi:hypothetical protein
MTITTRNVSTPATPATASAAATPSAPDLTRLFQGAHEDGDLSAASLAALTIHADVGAQIAAGLGVAPDDVPASEVVLVTLMPDDSGSIRFAGNSEVVRVGHNLVLDALGQARQRDAILAHTRYLNGHVLFPYRPLAQATRLDDRNYNPQLGTPLYDQLAVLLGTVIAKTREFELAGVPVRSITLVITDGADEHSTRQSPATLRPLVEDLLRRETHIIAAMGIEDGHTDFRRVFGELGLPAHWILTPANSEREIRRAFQVFSQSATRASQSPAAFAHSALGGFGA